MIELQSVTKHYGSRAALQDVSLRVSSGVTGLLGPNGSGKSTLIKAILGLVRVDRGTGRVLGKAWPAEHRSIRELVGYLPEDDCYVVGLQGVECVRLVAQLSGLPRSEALRRAHEVLDFCDIGQERYRYVETYSTGMRQKLKFAQAIVHDPQLIILDEPTTGLDPTQRHEFLNRIATLAHDHKKAIMLSTHILHDVRQICEHVVILAGGRVRVAATLEELSRPVAPGLHVRVMGDGGRLAACARTHGGEAREVSFGTWLITGVTDAANIWQWAAEVGTPIERLEPARASLEQIFVDIVREHSHAHP